MGHHNTLAFNPFDHLYDTPRQLLRHSWFRGLLLATISTLSMGCMGSAVLPLAGAVASTGIIVGIGTALLVSVMNVYTSRMLLDQARATGAHDYESLGCLVGGRWWQKFVEVSNWIILFGTIVGGIVQLGEAGVVAVEMVWCDAGTQGLWLLGPLQADGKLPGYVLMVLFVVVLVFPWCFLKSMKQLEYAGAVGYPLVLVMAFSIMARCVKEGFPAIQDKSLPVVGFTTLSHFASAVSTWAFAFYIQPVLMPYYAELPPGNVGLHAADMGTKTTLLGTALIPYLVIGFFGAAVWGPAAAETGNVLQNDIYGTFGPEGKAPCPTKSQGTLNILMSIYLAITLPVIEFALCHIVNTWVSQLRKRFKLQKWIPKRDQGVGGYIRNVLIDVLNLSTATGLAIACSSGTGSGKSAMVLTITGATGVLAVSYLIPIVNHFVLISGRAVVQKEWKATQGGTILAAPDAKAKDPEAGITVSFTSNKGSALSKDDLSFFAVGEDADTVPAATAWGSLSASRVSSHATADMHAAGHAHHDNAAAADADDMPQTGLARVLSEVARVDPESFVDDAPLINMYHSYKLAEPLAYCTSERSARFWLLEVAVPVFVVLFGIFCSICTLMGIEA